MSIQGILFDFNGTLFFDSRAHIQIFIDYFNEWGMEDQGAEFVVSHIFGKDNATILRQFVNPNATDEDCDAFSFEKEERYRQFCLAHPEMLHLNEGVPQMLDYLKEQGIPYALATGSELDNMNFFRKHLGLGRWFTDENTVYIDGTFRGKPEPDIYLLAAGKIGVAPENCLVFEDGTSGILAATRAGVRNIVAVHEKNLPSPVKDGISVCETLHGFTKWQEILATYGLMR